MLKRLFLLVLAAALLAGCGSSSSSPGDTTPTPHRPATAHPSSTPRSIVTPAPKTPVAPPPPIPTHTPFPKNDYTATVRGTVTDSRTGSPLSGAQISVNNGAKTTTTSAFGAYKVSFPAGAPAAITVTIPGFVQGLAMGALKPHQTVRVNFKLTKVTPGTPQVPPAPKGFGTP